MSFTDSAKKPLPRLLSFFLKKYYRHVLIGAFAIVVVDLSELLLPLLLKRMVDSFETGNTLELIPSTLLGVAILVLIQVGCRYLWRVSLSRGAMMAGGDLRKDFSKQIFEVPVSFFDRRKVGDLMTLITSDVENMRMALGPGMISLIDSLFYCITIPIAMYLVSPEIALKMILPMLFVPVGVMLLQKKISILSKNVQEEIGKLGTETQEMVAGVRLAKIYGIEERVHEKLNAQNKRLNFNQIALAKVQAAFGPSLELFLSTSLVILFGLGSHASVGTLVAMQRYLQKLMWPMSAIGMAVVYFQKAKASGFEYYAFLDETKAEHVTGETINRSQQVENLKTDVPLIEARNLSFSYGAGQKPIFENVSFKLQAGEWLGLQGAVASGKSTLLSLILKFYEVKRGQLFVLGKDVAEWNPQELRTLFSSVLQDPYLFQGSIRHNLDMGGDEIEVTTDMALKHAEVQGVLVEERMDEKLGEKGSGLSGGQKQRVAIARALRKNAPIFLLDDPLSSVDLRTSRQVLANLTNELRKKNKTVLFVSHHPEHLEFCDRVIRL